MAPCLITSSIKSTMSVEARPEVEQVCDPNRKQVSCAVLHKEKIVVAHMEQCPKLVFYVSKHRQQPGCADSPHKAVRSGYGAVAFTVKIW